jgi:hypothetical protein
VKQITCPGAGCNARFCPRCGGAEHTGTLCSPDTQVHRQTNAVALWPPQGMGVALQLHPSLQAYTTAVDVCLLGQSDLSAQNLGLQHQFRLNPCVVELQDAKLMEWAAKKKKAVQACPQCYRLIEKGGGCKCACVMGYDMLAAVRVQPPPQMPSTFCSSRTSLCACCLITRCISDDRYMQCPTNLGGCGHEFCWLCRYVSDF